MRCAVSPQTFVAAWRHATLFTQRKRFVVGNGKKPANELLDIIALSL